MKQENRVQRVIHRCSPAFPENCSAGAREREREGGRRETRKREREGGKKREGERENGRGWGGKGGGGGEREGERPGDEGGRRGGQTQTGSWKRSPHLKRSQCFVTVQIPAFEFECLRVSRRRSIPTVLVPATLQRLHGSVTVLVPARNCPCTCVSAAGILRLLHPLRLKGLIALQEAYSYSPPHSLQYIQ